MILEFGDDFCTPCEPIAWIWHEGNNPIGHRTTAVVDVVDVHLPEIHTVSLVHQNIYMITILPTALVVMNMLSRATTKW